MSRTSLALLALASLAASVAARPAAAHGVTSEVDQREGAVAVRVRYHGGRPLADARYEVQSPRGGDAPFEEGRTDRHGWLAFTPDVAGTWKVRIADASGHGKVVDVEVESVAAVAPAPVAAVEPPLPGPLPRGAEERRDPPPPSIPPPPAGDVDPTISRIVAGAGAIVALFAALFAFQRARRGKAP